MNQTTPYNLFDDIVKTAKLRGSHIAMIDGSRSISYSKMLKAARSAASELKTSGIKDYAKCVLIGNDSPEYIYTALGILANKGVFVSAGKEITNSHFNELLTKISVDFAILEKDFCKKLIPEDYKRYRSFKIGNKQFHIFCKNPLGSGSGLLKAQELGSKILPGSLRRKNEHVNSTSLTPKDFCKINPAFIRFTSGTTGESKGVVLSHQTIRERTESANSALNITEDDRVLWLLPMAYHFAVTIMLFLRKGCTLDIAVDDNSKNVIAKLLNSTKSSPTFVYATPYHYGNMVREAEAKEKSADIADSVRLLISTAMPLTEELSAKFAQTFNRRLNQAYGIIECGLPCVNTSPTEQNVLSVGQHLPGYQLRIALEYKQDKTGEILIKGPGFFDAYFDPWLTSEKILSKGWFHTGDMGCFCSDGTLQIVGRKKSVINFLGLKIFPEQVEQVLLQHPSVADVRVFGEDHADFGQIVIAEIAPEKNKKINEIKMTKFCAETLSQQEIPQEFRTVKKISKTASGKVKR